MYSTPTHTVHNYTPTQTLSFPSAFISWNTHKAVFIAKLIIFRVFWGPLAFGRFWTGTSRILLILTLSYNTPLIYLQMSNRKDSSFFHWATTPSFLYSQMSNRNELLFCHWAITLTSQLSNRKDTYFFHTVQYSYNTLSSLSAGVEQEGYFLLLLNYKTLSYHSAGSNRKDTSFLSFEQARYFFRPLSYNTLYSLFLQVSNREEFRRAFAAATVHDMFNWLTVIVLLIVEVPVRYFIAYRTRTMICKKGALLAVNLCPHNYKGS